MDIQITLEDDKFIYNFTTGKIYIKLKNDIRETGLCKNSMGYHVCEIDGKLKRVHRVLFEKYHGIIPDGMEVDHINRIPTDNCIENLRLATRTQNQQNTRKHFDNTSGFKNISWHKRNCKWQVQLGVNGINKNYGYFENIEDAIKKRDETIVILNHQGHIFTV